MVDYPGNFALMILVPRTPNNQAHPIAGRFKRTTINIGVKETMFCDTAIAKMPQEQRKNRAPKTIFSFRIGVVTLRKRTFPSTRPARNAPIMTKGNATPHTVMAAATVALAFPCVMSAMSDKANSEKMNA